MNSEIEIKLRHYKNNLAIGGRGYIFFGIGVMYSAVMRIVTACIS